MKRGYLKLCEKAKMPVDAIRHWPETEQPAVVMARLRRYKAVRGYTLATVAAILEAERNEPPITGTPIHVPGLSAAAGALLSDTRRKTAARARRRTEAAV